MTSVLLEKSLGGILPKILLSKEAFDNVLSIEKKMPGTLIPGIKQIDSKHEPLKEAQQPSFILADVPNFHKEKGTPMSEGFIKFPRSLFNDPIWKGLRLKYQKVFLTILCHTSYSQRTYSVNHHLITVGPGQLCISLRSLIDLCNQEVRYKEDLVDKNIIERAVSVFIKIGLVRQEVRHQRCVFSIIYKDLFDHFKTQTETATETKPRHNRDTNEERKEREDIKETIESIDSIDGAKALDSSLFHKKEERKRVVKEVDSKTEILVDQLWQISKTSGIAEGTTSNGKPGIKRADLVTWLKKYELSEIKEAMRISIGKDIHTSFGAYITKLLRDEIPKKEADQVKGRELVTKLVKKHDMKHLDFKKDYFVDLFTNEQINYSLPEGTLLDILERSYNRAKDINNQKIYEETY